MPPLADEYLRRGAVVNRRKYIFELSSIPSDIKNFHKANKVLTKTERFMSGFLQSCVRYGYVKSYRTQQIIKLGESDKFIMADFFLHWPEVIIEVDGPEHLSVKDNFRDAEVLRLFAYQTLRVTNKEVRKDNRKVRARLISELASAEGMTPRQCRRRVKEYFDRQKTEGYDQYGQLRSK